MPRKYVILITAIFILGCSGNPMSPDTPSEIPQSEVISSAYYPNHHLANFSFISLDSQTGEIQVILVRTSEMHLNITNIMNNFMKLSASGVPSETDPPNGLFVFDISIEHPFPAKPQFTGFDVKGILMVPGTLGIGPLILPDIANGETNLLNADGYTRWWNPPEFTQSGLFGYTKGNLTNSPGTALTATVNPYKYFADILDFDTDMSAVVTSHLTDDDGRGVFTAGTTNTRRYRIRFPTAPLKIIYGYAVDVAWAAASVNPPVEIPEDFSIDVNQPEPYNVEIELDDNSLYYDTEAGVGGGVLVLRINVSDWQGQDAGDIFAQIETVRIFAPGLFSGGVDADPLVEILNTATYRVDLTGTAVPQKAGFHLIMARVGIIDDSTYQQSAAPAPSATISAYQVLLINIPNPDCGLDGNNDFAEAIVTLPFSEINDQVCEPDDPSDYFYFDFPPGKKISGEFRLFADTACSLRLYDNDHHLLVQADSVDGVARLFLDDYLIWPEMNYIEVTTCVLSQVSPYLLKNFTYMNDIEPDSVPEVTPDSLFMNANCVYQTQTHVILTGLYGYWVYTMSSPSNPQLVSHEDMYVGSISHFDSPRLYFSDGDVLTGGISMINFSNPASPVFHENIITTTGNVTGVVSNGDYIFVGVDNVISKDIEIWDDSLDPLNPVFYADLPVTGSVKGVSIMRESQTFRHLVVNTSDSIRFYNIDNIDSIFENGSWALPPGVFNDIESFNEDVWFTIYNFATHEGTLYGIEHGVINSNVTLLGSKLLPGTAEDLDKWGDLIYVGDGIEGMTVCDISDPANIVIESTIPLISYGMDCWIKGDVLTIIPEDAGMQVIDTTPSDNPTILHSLPVVNAPRAVDIDAKYLYACERAGLLNAVKAVDISDPYNAYMCGMISTADFPRQISVDDGILAVTTSYTCKIIDTSDPTNMFLHDSISLNNNPTGVEVSGNFVYLIKKGKQLLIYDISNPDSPVLEDTESTPEETNDITLGDGYIYLAFTGGVYTYSLTDMVDPVYESTYTTTEEVSETEIEGNYLVIVMPTTVEIANLFDPSTPVKIGSVTDPQFVDLTQVAVDEYYAYVQGNNLPVYAVNLYPPESPSLYGMLYEQNIIVIFGTQTDLALSGRYIYGAHPYTGIRIHQLY